MPNKETYAQQQKRLRPKFIDVAKQYLDGERLQTALEFLVYLDENGITLLYNSLNAWSGSFKGRRELFSIKHANVAFGNVIEKDNDSWSICHNIDMKRLEDIVSTDEYLKEIVWRNLKYCYNCHHHCDFNEKLERKMNILGKEFAGLCNTWFVMKNPNDEDIKFAKIIIEANKNILKQKNAMSNIEEVIINSLESDNMYNALDFISYLKSKKMKFVFSPRMYWMIKHKNKNICAIYIHMPEHYKPYTKLNAGSWRVDFNNETMANPTYENLNDILKSIENFVE